MFYIAICSVRVFYHFLNFFFFLQGDLFSESVPEKKPSKKIVESEDEEEEEGMS